jgi:hypothetical protein
LRIETGIGRLLCGEQEELCHEVTDSKEGEAEAVRDITVL